jgi:hypothetical protein
MFAHTKETTWQQFGAAIQMLENAITACPDELWHTKIDWHEFWYLTYHTLFFLDYYLDDSPDGFRPPMPFTLSELDPSGVLPDRIYTKAELLMYLQHGREKCYTVLAALEAGRAMQPSPHRNGQVSVLELHLYSMRHVQHHAAQLNLLLRQKIDSAPRWVSKAGPALS